MDRRLPVFFISIVFLHVAYKATRESLTDELLDVLATVYPVARQISTTDEDLRCFYESVRSFIGDVLSLRSVRCAKNVRYFRKLGVHERQATPMIQRDQLNKSELVELLQQSAVEHLTTFRELEAQDPYCIPPFVTTEFEALYAYKHGEYQRCLQLSAQNVRTLFDHKARRFVLEMPNIFALPEVIQLMEDEIVSLIALSVIIDPSYRKDIEYVCISQPSLSLYLMTQCQIKLRHSLATTYQRVKVARQWAIYPPLDVPLLKLIEHKIQKYVV